MRHVRQSRDIFWPLEADEIAWIGRYFRPPKPLELARRFEAIGIDVDETVEGCGRVWSAYWLRQYIHLLNDKSGAGDSVFNPERRGESFHKSRFSGTEVAGEREDDGGCR